MSHSTMQHPLVLNAARASLLGFAVLTLAPAVAQRPRIVIQQHDEKSIKLIPFNYNRVAGEQESFYLRTATSFWCCRPR